MGSSTSKPRKGHEHEHHLPKVGTSENQQWEHETHEQVLFGSGVKRAIVLGIFALAVLGLLIINL